MHKNSITVTERLYNFLQLIKESIISYRKQSDMGLILVEMVMAVFMWLPVVTEVMKETTVTMMDMPIQYILLQ